MSDLPPPPPLSPAAPSTDQTFRGLASPANVAPTPSRVQSLSWDGNKLVLAGTGLRRFMPSPVTCIFRSDEGEMVTAVIHSASMGTMVVWLSADDQSSIAVLDRLAYRPDPVSADKALERYKDSALPHDTRVVPSAIPEVAGSVTFDGHVVVVTLDGNDRYFLPVDPQRPVLIGRLELPEGGLRVELEVSALGRVRLVVPRSARGSTERGLLFLRQPETASRPRRWEYRMVKNMLASSLEEQLNVLGQDGWELVSITGLDNTVTLTGNKLFAVMKRPC